MSHNIIDEYKRPGYRENTAMKLLPWSPVFLAALSASAQNIGIGAPSNGTSIKAGSNFTVEIDQAVRVSLRLT